MHRSGIAAGLLHFSLASGAAARPRSEPKHKERKGREDLEKSGAFEFLERSFNVLLAGLDFLGEDFATHWHDSAIVRPSSQADQEALLDHAFVWLSISSFGNVA
jgi:hypothetical protein